MTRARDVVRMVVVVGVIFLVACASYWFVTVVGHGAISEWAKYVSWFFGLEGTLLVALVVRTYDVQNIEALSAEQREAVRVRVKRRADALWSLFAINVVGGLSCLAAILFKEPQFGVPAATMLIFFLAVATVGLMTLPSWYHHIELFKSHIIEQERAQKSRAELIKSMKQQADAGYKPDAGLDKYNRVIEPNSHA